MLDNVFFGSFDIAQLALYAFWIFFAGLVIYLQRENSREGYPLVDEATGKRNIGARFGQPDAKTFKLAHGLKERVLGDIGRTIWILFASAGLLLLIAVANITGTRRRVDRRTVTPLWELALHDGSNARCSAFTALS